MDGHVGFAGARRVWDAAHWPGLGPVMPAPSPLLTHCPPTLPARAYRDEGWYQRDLAAIWAREWVQAGRLADLPPMRMQRIDVAGQSLILIRDRDDSLRCFHNTCRHRGAELCAESREMRSRLITCPYHAWAYDLTGRLISTGFGTPTDDFRREDHGLFGVAVRVWMGFIYVCLADSPPAFAPDPAADLLANWPIAVLVTGHVLEATLACNWKLFWENYNECLHCPGIHPELSDLVPVYRHGIMAPNEMANEAAHPEPDQPALRHGARTWTGSGQPCGPEFPGLTEAERDAGHTFVTVLPSQFLVAHVDYVRSVTLTPLGPERTHLRVEWLFAPETLAQPGFDAAGVAAFATTVLQQDAAACEMNQRGLRSGRYSAGRLMPQEYELARFHTWVLDHHAAHLEVPS